MPTNKTSCGVPFGSAKLTPAKAIVSAMGGKVHRIKRRLPKVSIVQIAGIAPTKLTKPKTTDAHSAAKAEKLDVAKMVEL